jgi:hypothetical protein
VQTPDPKRWQVVCRGLPIDVDFAVRGWADHGMQWSGRHRTLTAFIVNHWTGAENPPASVYANMKQKGLSVHFIVDAAGVVYQMADTELRAAHAGDVNATSIGIEYVNRGNAITNPNRGTPRKIVTATLQGKPARYCEMSEAQMRVGVKLNRLLCNLYGMELRVPLEADGTLILRELSSKELARFTGSIGHLHVEPFKLDPGEGLLRALRDAG